MRNTNLELMQRHISKKNGEQRYPYSVTGIDNSYLGKGYSNSKTNLKININRTRSFKC